MHNWILDCFNFFSTFFIFIVYYLRANTIPMLFFTMHKLSQQLGQAPKLKVHSSPFVPVYASDRICKDNAT